MSTNDDPTKTPEAPAKTAASARALALTIVAHPDLRRVGDRAIIAASRAGAAHPLSRNEPDFSAPGKVWGRPLGDAYISRRPLTLSIERQGGVGLRLGQSGTRVAAQGEPIAEGAYFGDDELRAGITLELSERVALLLSWHSPIQSVPGERFELVGESGPIVRVRQEIGRVADLDAPVLLRGESGVGKELAARAIHRASSRRDNPLVSVNLGAVPASLAAAELFGHVKGAFTGAVSNRLGYFRAAHGGTLFLDEVGESSPEIQVLLLRAVETGEIYQVGGQAPQKVDVRLIAATDSDLEARVQRGGFKAPLLHRLASYEIWLPSLRERRDDIGRLFVHFAARELAQVGESFRMEPTDSDAPPWLPPQLAARLVRYHWPGNVRELRNVTRQLIIDNRGLPQLRPGPRLERLLRTPPPAPPVEASHENAVRERTPSRRKPSDIHPDELMAAIEDNDWNLAAAAKQLRIARPSLYDLLRANPDLQLAEDLDRAEIERCAQECDNDLGPMARRLKVSVPALRRRMKRLGIDLDP